VPRAQGNCLFCKVLGKKAMSQKIRITTRANQFEQRKQEHLRAGYLIEDEQPFPMNGFCSFTAVRIVADEELERMALSQSNPPAG
jgi:radical SAM superfamily enzyme